MYSVQDAERGEEQARFRSRLYARGMPTGRHLENEVVLGAWVLFHVERLMLQGEMGPHPFN